MEIKTNTKPSKKYFIPYYLEKEKIQFFSKNTLEKEIKEELKFLEFDIKSKQTISFKLKNSIITLFHIDKKLTSKEIQNSTTSIFSHIQTQKEISIDLNNFKEKEILKIIEHLFLQEYKFCKYISKKENKKESIKINIITKLNIQKEIKELQILTNSTKFTRDLVNENSNIMTPIKLESLAKEFSKKHKLKFKSLNEKQIVKEKLNLLYAVGCGSSNPPRLVILEYIGDKNNKEKTALIGKGITFDTGGTNLKPTGYLEDMKMDMGGAATMFGTFKAIVENKIKTNVILVMSCAENSISSNSFKPGDVYTSYLGKSVEILNTDAEGRLVLADAIEYTQKNYKPTTIIDAATLTGACLVALGPSLIAMLGNDEKIKKQIFQSGEETLDRVWGLPIYDEHRDLLKSKIADLKNIGGRYGGTITAAAFLESFVQEKTKWIHLDIAGAAWDKTTYATGIGVRLLYNYFKNSK